MPALAVSRSERVYENSPLRSIYTFSAAHRGLTSRRSRQAAAIVARRLRRLALLERSCQGASEDFVPPAAQRKVVRPTEARSRKGV